MSNSSGPAPTSDDRPADASADDAAAPADSSTKQNPEEPAFEENGAGEAPASEENASDPAALRAELDALRQEHDALRADHQETEDRLLRTAAEMQNVRRRAASEQRRRAATARASTLRPLLEVLDDLQRALAADADAPAAETQEDAEAARQSLRGGLEMVETKFEDALAGQGVEPIEAEGQPFDETVHEAMMQQPAPEGTAPGTVLAEIRRGYRMAASGDEDGEGGRVLRHSRVVVAAQPEAPAEDAAAAEAAAGEERSEDAAARP